MPSDHWTRVAAEMVTALRGNLSRAHFSRRLGYRTNAVSDWEAGRRVPTAAEFLRVCGQCRVDVDAAFTQFHPATASLLRDGDQLTLGRWLDALRGTTSVRSVAERAALSRFAVSRVLRDQTRPRLHEFLQLLEGLTFRASDLIGALVPIDKLPTLVGEHSRRHAARRLAFAYPESEALLRVMETERYRRLDAHEPGALGRTVGIEPAREREVLAAMEQAGIVRRVGARYEPDRPLTVDTSAEAEALARLKAHWTATALRRLEEPARSEDWLGYNLMSLSHADLAQAREILVRAYREIRSLAAASEPVEAAALLNMQLLVFAPISPRDDDEASGA